MLANMELDGAKTAQACGGPTPTPTPDTEHRGTPNDGSMVNSVIIYDSTGVVYSGSNANYKYSGNKIRDVLYSLAEVWHSSNPDGPRIQINVISAQEGGDIGHSSHQNVLDFDIRYVRKDSTEGPLQLPSSNYDQTRTQDLIDLFIDTGKIDIIFTCADANLSSSKINTNYSSTHKDHMHIRFTNPSGWN